MPDVESWLFCSMIFINFLMFDFGWNIWTCPKHFIEHPTCLTFCSAIKHPASSILIRQYFQNFWSKISNVFMIYDCWNFYLLLVSERNRVSDSYYQFFFYITPGHIKIENIETKLFSVQKLWKLFLNPTVCWKLVMFHDDSCKRYLCWTTNLENNVWWIFDSFALVFGVLMSAIINIYIEDLCDFFYHRVLIIR